jgi:hypothetical protein
MAILSFAQRAEYASDLPTSVLEAVAKGEPPPGPYAAATDLVGSLPAGAELGIRNRFKKNKAVLDQKREAEEKNRELGLNAPPEPDIVSKIVAESQGGGEESPFAGGQEQGLPQEGLPVQNVSSGGIVGLSNGGQAQSYPDLPIPDSIWNRALEDETFGNEFMTLLAEEAMESDPSLFENESWWDQTAGARNLAWDLVKPEAPWTREEGFNPWGLLDWGVMGAGALGTVGSGGLASVPISTALASYKAARKAGKVADAAKAVAQLRKLGTSPLRQKIFSPLQSIQRNITSRSMPSWLGGRSWKGKQDTIAETLGRVVTDARLSSNPVLSGLATLLSRQDRLKTVMPSGATSMPINTQGVGDVFLRRFFPSLFGSVALGANVADVAGNVRDPDVNRYMGDQRDPWETLSPKGQEVVTQRLANQQTRKAREELQEYLDEVANRGGGSTGGGLGGFSSILDTLTEASGGARDEYKTYVDETLRPRLTELSGTEEKLVDAYSDIRDIAERFTVSDDTRRSNALNIGLASLAHGLSTGKQNIPGDIVANMEGTEKEIRDYQEGVDRKNLELGLMANTADVNSLQIRAERERSADMLDLPIYTDKMEEEKTNIGLAMEMIIRERVAEIQAAAQINRLNVPSVSDITNLADYELMKAIQGGEDPTKQLAILDEIMESLTNRYKQGLGLSNVP